MLRLEGRHTPATFDMWANTASLELNGTDEAVVLAYDANLDMNGEASVTWGGRWYSDDFDQTNAVPGPWHARGASYSQYGLTIDTGGIPTAIVRIGGAWKSVASDIALVNGEWHSVFATIFDSRLRIYVAGVERGSIAVSGTLDTVTNPTDYVSIGRGQSGRYFAGHVDELPIIRGERDPAWMYWAGGGAPRDLSDEPGLELYVRTEEWTLIDSSDNGLTLTAENLAAENLNYWQLP